MEFFITCDANWEAKIDKVLDAFHKTGYERFFEKRNYSSSLDGIVIVLMCRSTYLKFKQRIRFVRTDRKIYMDIMLNFDQLILVDQEARVKIVAEKVIEEVPLIIAKYKLKDFDLSKFKVDIKRMFNKSFKGPSVVNNKEQVTTTGNS